MENDRLPPHSDEAERALIGSILLNAAEVLPDIETQLTAESFYDLRHTIIFEAIEHLSAAGRPVDCVTVQDHLAATGRLEEVGGLIYLSDCMDKTASAYNATYYAEIIKEKALLRALVRFGAEVSKDAMEFAGQDVSKFLDEQETKIMRIGDGYAGPETNGPGMKALVHRALEFFEERHQNRGTLAGISTGFPDLDKKTQGMKRGEMWVLGARPSMGKTSLAMNIAEHVAVDQKIPVGVFSLEMTDEALTQRLICSRAKVNLSRAVEGEMWESDFPKLTMATGAISQAPIHIDDTSGLSIGQLRARARRMHHRHGCRLFVVDYLQLISGTKRRDANREREVAEVSNGVKQLAKELGVPIIVLAQLNRELEKRKKGKPTLADLRESGAIEQDADLVGLLYRRLTNEDEDDDERSAILPVSMNIAKQRNGGVGDVHFTFFKEITRFEPAAKVDPKDYPA